MTYRPRPLPPPDVWAVPPKPQPADTAHLTRLATQLQEGDFEAELVRRSGREVVHVVNPRARRLNADVEVDGWIYRWLWAEGIGPITEVGGVAERIMYQLREPRP